VASLPPEKFRNYLSKEGFFTTDQSMQGDTIAQVFQLTARKAAHITDSASRYAKGLFFNNKTAFSYYTTSDEECQTIIRSLKENGFNCEGENIQLPFLYQRG